MSRPRTKEEAVLDVRYHIRLHFLHSRLFNRLRSFAVLVELAAGSAAFVAMLNQSAVTISITAAIVALVTFLDIAFRWSERTAAHDLWRRKMAVLLAKSFHLSVDEIDAALAEHDGEVHDELESLRLVALNDIARANDHSDWVRPESRLERAIRIIA